MTGFIISLTGDVFYSFLFPGGVFGCFDVFRYVADRLFIDVDRFIDLDNLFNELRYLDVYDLFTHFKLIHRDLCFSSITRSAAIIIAPYAV